MAKVRKAVITAAGRGTRQYPASTAVQKEMFPLVDRDGLTKPVIQIIGEEAIESGIEELCIITQPGEEKLYREYFKRLDTFRADMDTLAEVEPVYETLPGWRGNISACRRFEELPKEAQQYVKRVEQLIGAPIKMVSVGPERTATIMR